MSREGVSARPVQMRALTRGSGGSGREDANGEWSRPSRIKRHHIARAPNANGAFAAELRVRIEIKDGQSRRESAASRGRRH
ncbi:hypothetical protein SAMD00023353_2200100 [Rosellinia necatrix]|uniref:Uncharacterized protein n=1 Tax=Rosellinia necatrix TaxID=77044 RepID=A0A1S8A875_ROSNE|nr:hypothetical protein SAMD00023353_2200100 [Rosellinia necatrix]